MICFPWNRPREICIGTGSVVIGHGALNGRGFVFIRPVSTPGQVGTVPPGYSAERNSVRPSRRDTIIWIDGPTSGLRASLNAAVRLTKPAPEDAA